MRNHKLVNLTPHDLVIYLSDPADPSGVAVVWPSEGLARVSEVHVEGAWPTGIALQLHGSTDGGGACRFRPVTKTYGEIEGLPERTDGVYYVVSLVVLQALKGSRPDVFAPDSGPGSAVRDKAGKIVGVHTLMQLA